MDTASCPLMVLTGTLLWEVLEEDRLDFMFAERWEAPFGPGLLSVDHARGVCGGVLCCARLVLVSRFRLCEFVDASEARREGERQAGDVEEEEVAGFDISATATEVLTAEMGNVEVRVLLRRREGGGGERVELPRLECAMRCAWKEPERGVLRKGLVCVIDGAFDRGGVGYIPCS